MKTETHKKKHADVIRVTKTGTFEMAHALNDYDGPCRNIHGHSYKIRVTVAGEINKKKSSSGYGMVLDFKKLKSAIQNVVKKFDHALVLNEESPWAEKKVKKGEGKVILVPYQPTCENLLIAIKDQLLEEFGNHCVLYSVRLDETETCYAEWDLRDNNKN